jgi:prefoldin subunit 5|tara:strand:+ start:2315 stop:2467 length:153 start_codon:yes stop_codon:yes gene_type:complete
MNNRGPNDLEEKIERLEKKNEELKKDNWTLAKEIDRLNEYVQVLEMEKRK